MDTLQSLLIDSHLQNFEYNKVSKLMLTINKDAKTFNNILFLHLILHTTLFKGKVHNPKNMSAKCEVHM